MFKLLVAGILLFASGAFYLKFADSRQIVSPILSVNQPSTTPTPLQTQTVKIIPKTFQVFQTFNNCGPAAMSMALSYFGINVSQQELGLSIRPYQNPQGNNDDKSVTLEELARESRRNGLLTYHRPAGDIKTLKLFISYDMPVIARTWLKDGDDIGHYRVVRGFDDNLGQIIQDDSMQGADLKYFYEDFLKLWQGFNYEYLVLVPKEKKALAESILGEDLYETKSWEKALQIAQQELESNPNNIFTKFNISVAFYNLGQFQKAVETFEGVENKLPFRMLWYQIEPILAYQKLKNHDRVFELTDKILNNHNLAFSELYQIRGEIYQDLGKPDLARAEFEKAKLFKQPANK